MIFSNTARKGENKRFGRIEFAIGTDVTKEFRKAVAEVEEWKPVMKERKGERRKTGKEWAEVCVVPNEIAYTKNAPVYRYLATRELLAQPELPGMEGQVGLPFPTMTIEKKRYKVFGIVTNRDLEGSEARQLAPRALRQERRSPFSHERRPGRREASFCRLRRERRLVGHNDSRLQPQLGNEAVGAEGIMGCQKDEGTQVLSYQSAGTGHDPCTGTRGKARQRTSIFYVLTLCTAADHGAWSCNGVGKTIREPQVADPKECEGELYPTLPLRRASDNAWITKPA